MRNPTDRGLELPFAASTSVREALATTGRTEDVRFSPTGHRLALAAFDSDRVLVLDVEVTASGVSSTGGVQLASPALRRPHGVEFLGEDRLIVANREGAVTVFDVPAGTASLRTVEREPTQTLVSADGVALEAPGSVSLAATEGSRSAILVCDTFGGTVSRHVVDAGHAGAETGEVVLRKWLDTPDGVGMSPDGQWIAVSNHNSHSVLVFENGSSLGPESDPVGMLRHVYAPHGVRFSADGRYVLVANAGAPSVHVYAGDHDSWRGVRNPVASMCVMDDALFDRGHTDAREGGPKGIDTDPSSTVLAVSAVQRPLAFFDLSCIGALITGDGRALGEDRLRYELLIVDQYNRAAAEAQAAFDLVIKSTSWRMTAAGRGAVDAVRNLRRRFLR